MELSSVTLRVLLLFFPGVLCAILLDALTVHRERTPVQFLTNAFALGMASYLSLAAARDVTASAAQWLRLREPLDVTFFDALIDDHVHIAWREIALAALVGMVLVAVISTVLNRRLVHRAAYSLGLTRNTGDIDVWSTMLNSPLGKYVLVRDLAQDAAYIGTVEIFSETSREAELLLSDVEVFRNTTFTKLYDTDHVYLARSATALVIEPMKEKSHRGGLNAHP
ncbi:hypothetical protein [Longimicrobium sp.]|uniref:hypothetical protein n=1 Tax=Longimicrobium sp. TaxID=2029185 RepID=UPI002C682E5D|nr:hypothetical protein [Longimicrobium sp.]HSU12943.1 hypothetical protein [Longimicrobium sp.]